MSKILMFHRVLPKKLINEPNAYLSVGTLISEEYLKQILLLIRESDFEVVTISELTERRKKKINTDGCISLTFDDGYIDNFEIVFPLLRKLEVTATFFPLVWPCTKDCVLPLDIYYQCVDEINMSRRERNKYLIGKKKKSFYWTEPSIQFAILERHFFHLPKKPNVNYMSGKHLKTMSECGFEIGSHGMTHSIMTADYMNEQKIMYELCNSKRSLEEIISKSVNSYCFPAGRYNNNSLELSKRAGYTSACIAQNRKNRSNSMVTYDRFFVKPNSINELNSFLHK